jgi:hypothetical protein
LLRNGGVRYGEEEIAEMKAKFVRMHVDNEAQ